MGGGGGLQDFRSLVTDWVLELNGTWLVLGLGGLGTKGLGTGLDNKYTKSILQQEDGTPLGLLHSRPPPELIS